ncbi:EAL domain-containing protein [Sphingomonas histidinilytica]|jgi:diguanylate cyclase (GGDEF)-like protein|uniref:Diguanylate cyclase/phosphodiesterase with PAS/PAC sensor(S) n=1 Tax=Rhizorhabdus histidinilytica TaxID=439228 RepID=A0A1T5B331_9SPHN|nr:EAL domain-containing protein [Rhizorhabdus histidinilytica]MBO9377861.1 EAL domain-containing protein [Rhizorhabdus histidinilytica]QEH79433.1 EAL domain-containing protein [Sphingomonas sp. C8-2]SKB41380.1 diguanylate cyclase/phosphodiesterase with PAS/PAC sensor(s) [Rhizorhabdus histidinilytica]
MRRVRGRSAFAIEGRGDGDDGGDGARMRFLRGLFPRGDAHDRQSVANRVRMATDALPLLLLADLIVAAGLWLLCRSAAGGAGPWLIAAPLLAMLAAGAVIRLVARRGKGAPAPERMHGFVALFGMVQGLGWSTWLLASATGLAPSRWAFAAVAHGGLLVVTTLVFAPVPTAALALWLCLAIAATVALGPWAAPLLLPLLAVAVVMLGGISERSYVASRRWLASAAIALKASLLLGEFEESGRGWFWETDDRGLITYISPQIAAALGLPADRLLGTPMTGLVLHEAGDGAGSGAGERTLGFHLATRLAFSEIAVRAAAGDDVRWWSLSGRPAFDEYGNFLGFRGSGTDLTEMRRSEAEVKRLASYDSLTGLPNRILMRRTLDESLRDVAGRPKRAALFMLDLDRFKMVNDTLGHPVGDALLRQVAARLQRVVQQDGQVGRLGGDEFNVVLPGIVEHNRLATLASAIIQEVSKPYMIDGAHVSIGASIGVAIAPDDGATADALVRNADLALYAAKADGKGVHRFYEPEMHASAKDRRLLEMDLRGVMSESGLHLVYQPVVDALSEEIVCFEALVRWDHPTRGSVSPADFIPVAEEIGLIPQIGEWVLRTACLEAANWPDPVRVAVNISPIQFANPALPGIVLSALAAAQLPPHRLELEITEGVFLNDDAATDAMFARLKAIGVRFALDDFGTGYSSLGYLKKAPFNKIKIDQSFVRGAAVPGNRNAAIIRAIVALAESLEMETTAEGAETPDELALIRSLGCSHIQGYIFGRPMLSDEARARVAGSGKLAMPGLLVTRDPRVAVLRSATIRSARGTEPARIRNLSRSGAMLECAIPFRPGEAVTLDLGHGKPVEGVIRWADEDRVGVAFDEPLEADQMAPQRLVRAANG